MKNKKTSIESDFDSAKKFLINIFVTISREFEKRGVHIMDQDYSALFKQIPLGNKSFFEFPFGSSEHSLRIILQVNENSKNMFCCELFFPKKVDKENHKTDLIPLRLLLNESILDKLSSFLKGEVKNDYSGRADFTRQMNELAHELSEEVIIV